MFCNTTYIKKQTILMHKIKSRPFFIKKIQSEQLPRELVIIITHRATEDAQWTTYAKEILHHSYLRLINT